MSTQAFTATLTDRALIILGGADWRSFLQGLITQDVETLGDGEARFAALLTPQGRLLYDLFLVGRGDGVLLDCAADAREALMRRLTMYRLRAKVTIEAAELPVQALWGAEAAPQGWARDPRLPALGWRGYGAAAPAGARQADAADYAAHLLACGAPGPSDWGVEKTYPVEANFDLLGGIDFKKGCFVGQETTSRMKRRGTVKTRMAPIVFEGAPPEPGSELLNGSLRAGEVLSGGDGRAMAAVRLDRLEGPLSLADGRAARVDFPDWLARALAPAQPA